jgi:hypothetical protein
VSAQGIPKGIAAAIEKCWPDRVVEEFPTDESYFHEISDGLERDFARIPGVALTWRSPAEDAGFDWDDDDDEPPPSEDFRSYRVYFLSPNGQEFRFETETEGFAEAEDPEPDEWPETTYSGEGQVGWAVAVSLVWPVALIHLSTVSHYEDGSSSLPEEIPAPLGSGTDEGATADGGFRETLSPQAIKKLDKLGAKIGDILSKHGVQVLDPEVLAMPVPGLRADSEVFLEPPLCVQDAFFFSGV